MSMIASTHVAREARASHQLHREEARLLFDEQLVQANEIGMRDAGKPSEFLLETVQIRRAVATQRLERHDLGPAFVVHFVDDAHATGSEAANDPEPLSARKPIAIADGGLPLEGMLEERGGVFVRRQEAHDIGPQRGIAGTEAVELRRPRRSIDAEQPIEDRSQLLMAVGGRMHA